MTMREILEQVARRRRMTVREMLNDGHYPRLVRARQEAMYLMAVEHDGVRRRYTYSQIGAAMGGLHHSTVIHGIQAHCQRRGLPYPTRRVDGVTYPRWMEAA